MCLAVGACAGGMEFLRPRGSSRGSQVLPTLLWVQRPCCGSVLLLAGSTAAIVQGAVGTERDCQAELWGARAVQGRDIEGSTAWSCSQLLGAVAGEGCSCEGKVGHPQCHGAVSKHGGKQCSPLGCLSPDIPACSVPLPCTGMWLQ